MARRKQPSLKESIIAELKELGTYRPIDDCLINNYVVLQLQFDALNADVIERGLSYHDEREVERRNPSLASLTTVSAQIVSLAKQLGIGVYGRKLTVASGEKKKVTETKVSQLKPRARRKTK